jgi:hypothetical protein
MVLDGSLFWLSSVNDKCLPCKSGLGLYACVDAAMLTQKNSGLSFKYEILFLPAMTLPG